jgi:hypothetical protein
MSYLANLIANKIRDELSLSINSEQTATSLRIFFSGPPFEILESTYKALLSNGDNLVLEVGEGKTSIPVFLLKPGAPDPKGDVRSTVCSENYFVAAVRNNPAIPRCLVLQNHISSVKSVDTTVTRLGGNLDVKDFEIWLESIWIQHVIALFIRELPHEVDKSRFNKAIEHTLQLSWNLESDKKQKMLVWRTLESISELFNTESNDISLTKITHRLGLISCDHGSFGSIQHLSLNEKITDFFDTKGLSLGFEHLKDKSPENIKSALKDFQNFLLQKQIIQASDLSDVGLHTLYGYCTSSSEIPSYWHLLNIDVWKELLDEDDNPEKEEVVLRVEPIDTLVDAQNNFPFLSQSKVNFRVDHNQAKPVEIRILRSVGSAKYAVLDNFELAPNADYDFCDSDIPEHQTYVRYQIQAVDFDTSTVSLKWIVLNQYGPALAISSRAAKKLKPFKLNKRALSNSGATLLRYESELSFASMGQFQIEFFSSDDVILPSFIKGYEVDSEHNDINCAVSSDGVCLIQTDEECFYDFSIKKSGDREVHFRLFIIAEDNPPKGVASEFDRLVETHLSKAHGGVTTKVEAIKARLFDLELQILDQPILSYKPVIFGPDYITSWSKIDWVGAAKVSNFGLMHDIRPDNLEQLIPKDFLAARVKVFDFLQQQSNGAFGAAELRLHEFSNDAMFLEALEMLIQTYLDWLSRDYESAIWIDTFLFFDMHSGTHGLSTKPYAVLLSPFHPIKLVYQFEAQSLMLNAIARHQECPAASLFTPSSFPDVFSLKHRTVAGSLDSIDFVGMQSSNPYWGVFWSMEEVGRSDYVKLSANLSDSLHLGLRGLTTGFTSQQMVRSLDEVVKLLSGKTTITVQLHSDAGGDSDCNVGIKNWANERMLPENDMWTETGALRVKVLDTRPDDMQPEQSTVAALTLATDSRLQWYTDRNKSVIDLSVIASLNATQPQFEAQGITSSVDKLGLSRSRIRKRLPDHYLAESLVMARVEYCDKPLVNKMLAVIATIEEQVSNNGHSGFLFAPNLFKLKEIIYDSKYTAVSSSNIDFQSFSELGDGKSFLWDYELPSYSRLAGGADGYYLLATHSEGMDAAVKTALKEFGSPEDEFSELDIKRLLNEVSKRGMPTLKRLTGGGNLTLGELGMLAAVRLLQPDFNTPDAATSAVFPIIGANDSLCLLLPVDPFQAHIDSLRKSLYKKTGERPDLLSMSLQYDGQDLKRIRITAIEVKARRGELGTKGRSAAISQASHFSNFLVELRDKGEASEIWGLAWRALLTSLIDYSFRVYSGVSHILDSTEWFELHSAAVHAVSRGTVEVQIDTCGRLISIEKIERTSFVESYDGDRFDETIVLSHADAVDIITDGGAELGKTVRAKMGDWQMTPKNALSDSIAENINKSIEIQTDDFRIDQRDLDTKTEIELSSASSGLRFNVGMTIGQLNNYPLQFYPANTALNQLNVGIVGDLGTGKTQLIKSLISQLVSNRILNRGVSPNILIFDYKRDYSDVNFVHSTGAKVISPYDIPLNIFTLPETENQQRAQHERSRFFIDVLDKIYSGIGPVQKEYIKNSVKQAYKKFELTELCPTLHDVFDCYKEEGRIDIPYSIMSNLVESEYFVNSSDEVIPFSEFLSGVVVIDLSQILADDDKNMLVAIFLNLFYEYMLSVEKKPFIGTSPSLRFVDTMLLVDEADNIMKYEFEVLRKLLLQGREFGVGVLLASQYLSHFKTRHQNYLEPLLTWFIHKVPNITARELENIGITSDLEQMASKIRSLNCHECLYKSLGVHGEIMRGTPFFELLIDPKNRS